MPNQTYRCPDKEHGEFDYFVKLGEDVPPFLACPVMMADSAERTTYTPCGTPSDWVPPTVAVIWKCSK